jgi:YHS domain-containing protein
MTKDPICGMSVDEKAAKFKSDYKGKTYYFCSQMCKTPSKIRQVARIVRRTRRLVS